MKNYKLRVTQATANTETNVRVTANKEGFFPTSKILGVSDKVPIVMEYIKYTNENGYSPERLKDYSTLNFYAYVEDRIATKIREYSNNLSADIVNYVNVSYSDPAIKWVFDGGQYNTTKLGYRTLGVYESYVNEQLLPKTKVINGENCTLVNFQVGMVCPDFEYNTEHPTQLTLTLKDPENISKPNSITLNVTVVGTGKLIDHPSTEGVTSEEYIYTISADQYGWTLQDPEATSSQWNVPSRWNDKYVNLPVKCVMTDNSGASYTWYGWSRPINKQEDLTNNNSSWYINDTHRAMTNNGFIFGNLKNTGFTYQYSGYGSSIYLQCFTEDGQPHPTFNSYGTDSKKAYAAGFSMKVYKLNY